MTDPTTAAAAHAYCDRYLLDSDLAALTDAEAIELRGRIESGHVEVSPTGVPCVYLASRREWLDLDSSE